MGYKSLIFSQLALEFILSIIDILEIIKKYMLQNNSMICKKCSNSYEDWSCDYCYKEFIINMR